MAQSSRKSTTKKKVPSKKPTQAAKTKPQQAVKAAALPSRASKRSRSIWTRLNLALRRMIQKEAPLKTPKRAANGARRLKEPRYMSFRLSKSLRSTRPKVPNSFRLLKMGLGTLRCHWVLFGAITLVYLVLSIVLVSGLGNTIDVTSVRDSAKSVFNGSWGTFVSGLAVIGSLLSTTTNPASDASGAYQSMLLVLFSLAFIWALRQRLAGTHVGVRDVFYKSMYPLVPFLLVMLVIMIELLPSVIAAYLYNLVFVQGLAVTLLEKILWGILIGLLIVWTVYMVMSSIFGLYIATLPEMRPMQALRSARELVRFRRWSVLRKLLFLPVALLLLVALLMFPIILFLPAIAQWSFFVLTLFSLAVVHAYMYTFYRELLK